MPDCCIGVDVIVGFPGETEEKFNETYEFLEALNISYLHVFSYSERDNTESLKINHKIPKKIRASPTVLSEISKSESTVGLALIFFGGLNKYLLR